MENGPFEDVFPIENGFHGYVSLPEGRYISLRALQVTVRQNWWSGRKPQQTSNELSAVRTTVRLESV